MIGYIAATLEIQNLLLPPEIGKNLSICHFSRATHVLFGNSLFVIALANFG
jgi:hypothetical protein